MTLNILRNLYFKLQVFLIIPCRQQKKRVIDDVKLFFFLNKNKVSNLIFNI
jgi:hypothetical protein